MVYIPDAMYRNERVTKAEVTADKGAVIKLDGGEEKYGRDKRKWFSRR